MALSQLEKAKRAFVSLLLLLARTHGLALGISRESPDPALLSAFRRVSRKVHPDRGGSLTEPQRLERSEQRSEGRSSERRAKRGGKREAKRG